MHAAGLILFIVWTQAASQPSPPDPSNEPPPIDLPPPIPAARVIEGFAAFVEQSKEAPAQAAAFVRTQLAGAGAEADCSALLDAGLALVSSEYKAALEFQETGDKGAERRFAALIDDDNPYLAANAAFYAVQSNIAQDNLRDAAATLDRLFRERAPLSQYTTRSDHLMFLLGYTQAHTLKYDSAMTTLARFLRDYPNAPERFRATAVQMQVELGRRQPGRLGDVYDLMSYARRELALGHTDPDVSEKQDEAVRLLNRLVKEAEEDEKKGGGGGSGRSGGRGGSRQKRQRSPSQASTPRSRSEPDPGGEAEKELHRARAAMPGESWGRMPPKEREQILQALQKQFPSQYRELVEQYYRQISKDAPPPVIAVLILMLSGAVGQPNETAASRNAPPFRITTIEGRTLHCESFGSDAARRITLGGASDVDAEAASKSPLPTDLDDLALLINDAANESKEAAASRPAGELTFFPQVGGRVRGIVTATGLSSVQGRIAAGVSGEATVAWTLGQIEAVQFENSLSPAAAEEFASRRKNRDKTRDQLIVQRDDGLTTFPGALEALTAQGWTFRVGDRTLRGAYDRAVGVVLADSRNEMPFDAVLHTTSGDEIRGTMIAADSRGVEIQIGTITTARWPWKQVARIEFRSRRVVFLSDLDPVSSENRGWFGTDWPYQRDRSTTGGPIRIGGRTYAKGLGVHSRSRLTFMVPDGCDRIAAIIGLDDAAVRGNVVFRVLEGDKALYDSGPLAAGQRPVEIVVPTGGAKRLTMEVDFGSGLDIGDHAIWGLARFLRNRPS